jgi:hypothetical protein
MLDESSRKVLLDGRSTTKVTIGGSLHLDLRSSATESEYANGRALNSADRGIGYDLYAVELGFPLNTAGFTFTIAAHALDTECAGCTLRISEAPNAASINE